MALAEAGEDAYEELTEFVAEITKMAETGSSPSERTWVSLRGRQQAVHDRMQAVKAELLTESPVGLGDNPDLGGVATTDPNATDPTDGSVLDQVQSAGNGVPDVNPPESTEGSGAETNQL